MAPITKDSVRTIIDNFAADIKAAKAAGSKPEKFIINFRDEKINRVERPIYFVPISLLRFRKENGRIASDVASYEKEHGILHEDNAEDQKILAEFLRNKDPDKTADLKKSIQRENQEEPAIITADGFLINGNRRKLVFDTLLEETKSSRFERMKVVILPGKGEPEPGEPGGGPPTNREIEQIENRYQFFRDGKSEYSNFDRVLSVRRKMEFGMTLEEQLKDDPVNADLPDKEFARVVQKYKNEFLHPLECVDRYLSWIGRDGVYTLISSRIGGKENRWQAFIDYYNYVWKKLQDPTERMKLGIEEKDVSKIEAIAFNLIRFRDFSQIGSGVKLHMLIRRLPGYLKNSLAKKALMPLGSLAEPDDIDAGTAPEDIDKRWININRTDIIRQVTKAKEAQERKGKMEKPLDLLRECLDKMNHEQMATDVIGLGDITEAMSLTESIEVRAKELRKEFYEHQKTTAKLLEKHK